MDLSLSQKCHYLFKYLPWFRTKSLSKQPSREQQESLECFYFHAWDKPLQSKCLLWLAWQVLMGWKIMQLIPLGQVKIHPLSASTSRAPV